MSKFLYFQDFHLKGKNSIYRKGDYFSDCLLKFDELLNIAKENKVEAILDGGDLLDTAEPSYRILDEIADRVEKTKIPIYSLFGNHAQLYHSMEHSRYTGLAHLQKRSSLFRYLNFLADMNTGTHIKGFEYKHDIEKEIKEKGIFLDDLAEFRIAIVHAFICPKIFPYASHVVCDDIKTNAHIILVAHYHAQWDKDVDGTQFIDIGSFGRNSITEANIEPSCILLDTDKRSYEIIKLKSAKKGKDIFDLEKYQELKQDNANIDEFIASLESVNFQGQRIDEIISSIAKEQNIDKNVVDCIIEKMEVLKNE